MIFMGMIPNIDFGKLSKFPFIQVPRFLLPEASELISNICQNFDGGKGRPYITLFDCDMF